MSPRRRGRRVYFRIFVNFFCEMTERVMIVVNLNERWKFSPANILGTIAAFGEWTARRQMRNIRRQAGNLIKLGSLLVRGIGNAPKQAARIWIRRRIEQFARRGLLEYLASVHH